NKDQTRQEINRGRQAVRGMHGIFFCLYCNKQCNTKESKRQHERKVHRKKGHVLIPPLVNMANDLPESSNAKTNIFNTRNTSTPLLGGDGGKYILVSEDCLQTLA